MINVQLYLKYVRRKGENSLTHHLMRNEDGLFYPWFRIFVEIAFLEGRVNKETGGVLSVVFCCNFFIVSHVIPPIDCDCLKDCFICTK